MMTRTVLIAALFSSTVLLQAQQTNYQWIASGNGTWENSANWNPSPSEQVIGGAFIGNPTIFDRVTIDGNHTVTRTGDIYLRTQSSSDPRFGTFNALTLANGSTLTVNGLLQITTSGGAVGGQAFVRNVAIGSGSTLNATEIITGTQNNVNARSTWTIDGTVNAGAFKGMQGSNTNTTAGRGFILNVNNGTLNVTGTFNWSFDANPANTARVGQVNIANNGVVVVGTMDLDWRSSQGNYVNFVDGTGSLSFGQSNWDLTSVQGLITDGYIRTAAQSMTLSVIGVDGNWLVTATAIPEASTTVGALGAIALVVAFGVRRRSRRS